MSRHLVAFALVLGFGAPACRAAPTAVADPEASSTAAPLPAADASPNTATAPNDANVLVYLDGGQLVVLDTLGRERERFAIEVEPGPSFFDDRGEAAELFVFEPTTRSIARIDLRTKRLLDRYELAKIVGCSAQVDPELDLQSRDDLRLGNDGLSLCVPLQDRNDNMMSIGVDYRIDLASGTVAARPSADLDRRCDPIGPDASGTVPKPDAVGGYDFLCSTSSKARRQAPPTVPDALRAVALETCALSLPNEHSLELPVTNVCEPDFLGLSANQRFLVVSLPSDEGDYIWSSLLVVDLTDAQLLTELTRAINGESSVVWSPDARSLFIDDELFVFDEATVRVLSLNASASFGRLP